MFANAIFKTIFRKPLILFRFNTLLVESSEFRVNIPRVTTEADKPLDKSPSTETPKEIPIEKETTIDESSNVVENTKKLVEPAIETLEIVAEPIKPAEKVLKPEEEEIFPDEENLAPVEEEIEESLEAANEILEITPHPEPPAPSIALKSELNDGIAIKNKRKKLKKSNKTDTTKGDVMMTPKKTQVPPDSEHEASPKSASKSPNQYTAWTTVTRSKKSPKSVSSQNASPSKNSLSPPDWVRTQQNLTFQWNQFIKGKQTLASNNRSAPTTPKSRPSRPSISTARPTFLSPPNIAKQIMESPIRAPKTTFNDFVTGLTKARPAAANARKSPPTPQPNLFERNVQSFVRVSSLLIKIFIVESI